MCIRVSITIRPRGKKTKRKKKGNVEKAEMTFVASKQGLSLCTSIETVLEQNPKVILKQQTTDDEKMHAEHHNSVTVPPYIFTLA